jgi:hypothetical protein
MPKDPAYTELYFADPSELPKDTMAPISFSYVIANRTAKAQTYNPEIQVQDAEGVYVADHTSVTVAQGTTAKVTSEITVPSRSTSITIVVYLPEQKQSIQFRIQTGVEQ